MSYYCGANFFQQYSPSPCNSYYSPCYQQHQASFYNCGSPSCFATPSPPPPPSNYCCQQVPVQRQCSTATYQRCREVPLVRNVNLNYYDVHTVVRDNNHHVIHNRTVVTQVNRHHWHTQRIVTNENKYDTYLTNNVIKVNDIHHQRVENVAGEKRTFKDYKQTQRVEPARCVVRGVSGATTAAAKPSQTTRFV